jgi:predicted dithiol-disulfide oxidoreductase (DUF899 family)
VDQRPGDELARKRRELPWLPVEKDYRLETDEGERTLAELFDGRSQLLVDHFMFGPSYAAGCPVDSSIVDGFDGLVPHLHARDVTLILVSRAPLAKLQAYKEWMGWTIPWVSSANSDFNFDLGASYTEEQMREAAPSLEQLPPIAHQNAAACGTDVLSYICEAPRVSAFCARGRCRLPDLHDHLARARVHHGPLPNPRTAPRRDATRATTTRQTWIRATTSTGTPNTVRRLRPV